MQKHTCDDLSSFGNLNLLDLSAYEHFNYTIITFIRMTSVWKGTSIKEAVNAMNATRVNSEKSVISSTIRKKHVLSRDGTKVGLETVCSSLCKLMEHLTRDARRALRNYIREIVLETASNKQQWSCSTRNGRVFDGCEVWLYHQLHE